MTGNTRKVRLATIRGLAVFLLVATALEAIARFIDPFGYWMRANQYSELMSITGEVDDSRGYAPIASSQLKGHRWQVTINERGQRVVPDTSLSDCTVTAVGDSITFGGGVSDQETWVNLLARKMSTVQFMNAGVGAYNIKQITEYLSMLESDGYILLSYDDDALPRGQIFPYNAPPFALSTYLLESGSRNPIQEDKEMYQQYMSGISQRNDILLLAFDSSELPLPEKVHIIPRFTETLSFIDIHPNKDGHQQIYRAVLPYVEPFVSRICG